jgi:glycosyltransferase involved in cell wall biosynthesis
MKILFVSAPALDARFGGAKPFLELAEQFEALGWQPELVSLAEEVPGHGSRVRVGRARFLCDLIASRGDAYDVVDFDHEYLPFERATFPRDTLLVARSVLLCQRVAVSSFPQHLSARRIVGRVLRDSARRADQREMAAFAQATVLNADLVNVSNDDDAEFLVQAGIERGKVVVLPFGMSASRLSDFALAPPEEDVTRVAFVGTFDWRKGAADMPRIVERVIRNAPGARFRLIGTSGMFSTADAVKRFFPRGLRPYVEVVPTYDPAQLPALLADCTLGFFPSYLEGFPFAVVEMLAASLPVVAYDVPGPRMMLDSNNLVAPGDVDAMAARIASRFRDPIALARERLAAKRRAEQFRWEDIAAATAGLYGRRLALLRADHTDVSGPAEAGKAHR